MKYLIILFGLLLVVNFCAQLAMAKPITVSYMKAGANNSRELDIYPALNCNRKCPVLFYIHGGGWHRGDKKNVGEKASYFTKKGFVFVSTNYRLADGSSNIKHPLQIQDIAAALAWVFDNIQRFNGDNQKIFVMGHSAGAHLAALISTNQKYLSQQGLRMSEVIKGTILLDANLYDLTSTTKGKREELIENAFNTHDSVSMVDASPFLQIEKSESLPKFLVVFAKRCPSAEASFLMYKKLLSNGNQALLVGDLDKSHSDINQLIGTTNNRLTAIIENFLLSRQQEQVQFVKNDINLPKHREKSVFNLLQSKCNIRISY